MRITLISDCITSELVTPWDQMDGPGERYDYFDVPAMPPQEAFGDMIENYRSLN